jgi:excisionase family DNA binding protein
MTLNEVADELGVHYMTAYRYVRLGLLDARQVGRSWMVRRSDLDAFRSNGDTRRPIRRGEAEWSERLRKRLLAGDESGAWSTVEAALASGSTVQDVYVSILTPALRDIGEMWQAGSIDVSDEHTASGVADRIISRLGPRVKTRGVKRGTVVLGSTATELHSLPVSIAADLLRAARFKVVDLGVNLPAESFAKAVGRADSLVAVAISVTTTGQSDEIETTISAIRSVTNRPIIIGGKGIDAAAALGLGADAYAGTAEDAIAALEDILDRD